ncbi:MAG: hypothetical protein HGA38_04165 [Candidatus Moranbacteria bacterium]|nr:hypothetical protein [Candidatus Moranbacteria bacterium]
MEEIKQTTVDIISLKKMSEDTGIPFGRLIVSLGIDPKAIYWWAEYPLNVKQLESLATLFQDDSPEENRIQAEINRLLSLEVERVSTLTDAVRVFLNSPAESDAAKTSFLKIIKLMKTCRDAEEIGTNHVYHFNDAQTRIFFERWLFLLSRFSDSAPLCLALDRVGTISCDDPLRDLIFEKILRLATTPHELKKFYSDPPYGYPERGRMYEERWDELFDLYIEASNTLESAHRAVIESRPHSSARKKAVEKQDALGLVRARKARTLEESETVVDLVSEDSEAASVAREKRETFALARIKSAKTFSKAKAAYEAVQRCSEQTKDEALENLLTSVSSEQEVQEACNLVCQQSGDEKAEIKVIRKLAGFYGWAPASES